MRVNFYLDEMDNPVIRQAEDNWDQSPKISFHIYNEEEMRKTFKPVSRKDILDDIKQAIAQIKNENR